MMILVYRICTSIPVQSSCDSEYTNDVILEAEICVQEKYDDLLNGELNSKVMYEAMVKRYIKKLHL